jgi:hypothetical protein
MRGKALRARPSGRVAARNPSSSRYGVAGSAVRSIVAPCIFGRTGSLRGWERLLSALGRASLRSAVPSVRLAAGVSDVQARPVVPGRRRVLRLTDVTREPFDNGIECTGGGARYDSRARGYASGGGVERAGRPVLRGELRAESRLPCSRWRASLPQSRISRVARAHGQRADERPSRRTAMYSQRPPSPRTDAGADAQGRLRYDLRHA